MKMKTPNLPYSKTPGSESNPALGKKRVVFGRKERKGFGQDLQDEQDLGKSIMGLWNYGKEPLWDYGIWARGILIIS